MVVCVCIDTHECMNRYCWCANYRKGILVFRFQSSILFIDEHNTDQTIKIFKLNVGHEQMSYREQAHLHTT